MEFEGPLDPSAAGLLVHLHQPVADSMEFEGSLDPSPLGLPPSDQTPLQSTLGQ